MVQLYGLEEADEVHFVHEMVRRHAEFTGSARARQVLADWEQLVPKFVKVLPNDYKRVNEAKKRFEAEGMSAEEAEMAAFELNAHDAARAGGR
jgi:glutamate synthase (ferredoxin)